jgi:cytochrome c-type biogenesis protein
MDADMIAAVSRDVTAWWAPGLAFLAGVVSFVSPCVLPLVPGYLSLVTGGQAPADADRRPLLPIVLFILGFSAVFTLIGGFTATALTRWL